jgi:hypothetical protein
VNSSLTSRERLLLAMRGHEPDHVPLWNLWRNRDIPFSYQTQVERAEAVLSLGLDDTLLLQPPLNKTEHYDANRAPGVRTTVRHVNAPDDAYPWLLKEWETPAGTLRQVVRQTDDWPHGEDVRLFSDHNISRSKEMPVKGPGDLVSLRQLLSEPTTAMIREFREEAARLRNDARRLGVVLEGGWTALGDAALWLLGTELLLLAQMDQRDFLDELLEIVCAWEIRRMDLLLDEKVEVIVHSAWYECTDFWTPKNYRRLLKPRLKRMVDRAHQAGALFSYIITTSWRPLIDDLLELGIDSLLGVDPVQGKADLREAKSRLGGRVCLWGGVNGALTMGHGSPSDVRHATEQAIELLGFGSRFVLYPVDQLVRETPWSNVQTMMEAWHRLGSYPIASPTELER